MSEMSKTKEKYLIFTINGGAGKNVLATAVAKAIKNKYPEHNLIVVTAYVDIWGYNPNVYRVYQFGNTPYFYESYIKDNEENVEIFGLEPYSTSDYILKRKHLIDIWCDLYGMKSNAFMPEMFFNHREVEFFVNNTLNNDKRPIMLIQTNGGMNQNMKVSWMRDMPLITAQKVVEHFKKQYRIIHIRRKDQPGLNGVDTFEGNLRDMAHLIRFSTKRLFIDSVCQHIAAALNKTSTVLWVRNSPQILGYSSHDNIITKVEDEIKSTSGSFLEPYDISGNIYQCPFKENTELFDAEEVIASIERQTN